MPLDRLAPERRQVVAQERLLHDLALGRRAREHAYDSGARIRYEVTRLLGRDVEYLADHPVCDPGRLAHDERGGLGPGQALEPSPRAVRARFRRWRPGRPALLVGKR